jgi:predicted nuclease with TOPRIM domain
LKAEKSSLADKLLESFKQLKNLTEKISTVEIENDNLHRRLYESNNTYETTKKNLDETVSLLSLNNDKLETQNKKFLADIMSGKKFFDDMDEFHKMREKSLETELSIVRKELEDLTKQIADVNAASKYRELLISSQPEEQSEKEVLISQVRCLQAELEISKEHLNFLKSDRLKFNHQLQLKDEEIENLSNLVNDLMSKGNDIKNSKDSKSIDEFKIDNKGQIDQQVLRPDQYVALLSLDKEVEVDVLDSIDTAQDIWADNINGDVIDVSLTGNVIDGKLFTIIQNLGLMYSHEEHGKVLIELAKSNNMKLTKNAFVDWYVRYIYS